MIWDTPAERAAMARFDGEGAKGLGLQRSDNPYPPGAECDAWAEGWDSAPATRRTEPGPPPCGFDSPRPCPDPNPRRVGYE